VLHQPGLFCFVKRTRVYFFVVFSQQILRRCGCPFSSLTLKFVNETA